MFTVKNFSVQIIIIRSIIR